MAVTPDKPVVTPEYAAAAPAAPAIPAFAGAGKVFFTGRTAEGEGLPLGAPFSFELKKDAGAADQLRAVFPASAIGENLFWVEGFLEGGLFFEGPADELWFEADRVTLIARSKMALLLDNEVMPQVIRNPSLSLLNRRFLEPLGFAARGDEAPREGELNVERGTSVYALLKGFCRRFLGCEPEAGRDGSFFCGTQGRREAEIGAGEIESLELRVRNDRVLSEALYPDSGAGGYSARFRNPSALLPRKKYLKQGETPEFAPRKELRLRLPRLTGLEPGDTLRTPKGAGRVEAVRVYWEAGRAVTELRAQMNS